MANLSFNAIHENKIIAKISQFTIMEFLLIAGDRSEGDHERCFEDTVHKIRECSYKDTCDISNITHLIAGNG